MYTYILYTYIYKPQDGNYKFIEKKIHYSNCALVDPSTKRNII